MKDKQTLFACVAKAIKGESRQNVAVSRGEAPLAADKSIFLIGLRASPPPFVAATPLACVIFPFLFFLSLPFPLPL